MKTKEDLFNQYIHDCQIRHDEIPIAGRAFYSAIEFANTWYDIKEFYAHEIEPLGEVLVMDAKGEIEIAKLVHIGSGRYKGWKLEIKNSETIIDLEHITQFKPIDIK